MKTNGRAGFLMFGPYEPMKAGHYILKVTGKITANSEGVVVDVVGQRGSKIYGRFEGVHPGENVLLQTDVVLGEAVEDLEVRILVEDKTEISITGYTLQPVTKRMQNEVNNTDPML